MWNDISDGHPIPGQNRWVWVQRFTSMYESKILHVTYMLPGEYLLYPPRTRPIAILRKDWDGDLNFISY
jgi:hypothetical protein